VDIPDSRLFQCQCMGEGVMASYFDPWDEEVAMVIVTVWHDASMGAGEWTWKTRLRAIWDIIRRGHVGYEYGVILDQGEALGLAEWLRTRPWPPKESFLAANRPPCDCGPGHLCDLHADWKKPSCGCIEHVVEEGSRQHVLSYSTAGGGSVVCSEPKCRQNCRHGKEAGP